MDEPGEGEVTGGEPFGDELHVAANSGAAGAVGGLSLQLDPPAVR